MSPSVDTMAHSNSNSSNKLSLSQHSSTDSMGLGGKNSFVSRFKRKLGLKKDDNSNANTSPPPPAPIDTKMANAGTGKPLNGPKAVIPKPGINRTESERRDRLVEAPLSPAERRNQRLNPRGTATSLALAPIQSMSVGDLNEGNSTDVRRRSFVDPKHLPSQQTPTTQKRASLSHQSPQQPHPVPQQMPSDSTDNQLERQTTAASTYDNRSQDSRSNYGGGPRPGDWEEKPPEDEPDWKWILNLSMHFKDYSHREKFFVTYAQDDQHRRRVTVSCDYRHAEPGSLEDQLSQLKSQKEKSQKIYEHIKDALQDIQFYDTTTNLKLQTDNGRLNVHVTEDMHEIIHYPPVAAIKHLDCEKIRESDLVFDSHLSGFVYKVYHQRKVYIKKEIPSPDTVDEFLYEINALYALRNSNNVIRFGGCVLDDRMEKVKGLLISFAPRGALIDILYNERGKLPWVVRESWARQIVAGLADIHEAGYVQGDFTLSNIVVDEDNSAKIIDINRRGCPVGWEPPEITVMIEGLQRIGIYIGVKSDIFQLGMCLWGIAMEHDEPEFEQRPLHLRNAPADVPDWYKKVVDLCLSPKPQDRPSAKDLLDKFFPPPVVNTVLSSPNNPPAAAGPPPLSPTIVEARPPFDDPNLSSPPSPAIPQPQPEYRRLSNLQYEIPLPDLSLVKGNIVDSEDNYERYEAGIEHSTNLEDEVMAPLDKVVDEVEPVSLSDPATAAAKAAWHGPAKENGKMNGNAAGKGKTSGGHENGVLSGKQVKPAALDISHNENSNGGAGLRENGGKGKSTPTNVGAGGGGGRNSPPMQTKHTDSGFAENMGDESPYTPVSPRTVVPPHPQKRRA